jgi:hypothetical protein
MQTAGITPKKVLSVDEAFSWQSREKKERFMRGSLVDDESTKINKTVFSITISELYACTKCFATCQFIKGLWMDISGSAAGLHMRTDANSLVTTAQTTYLPEQRGTIHMMNQLRHEVCSGTMDDLAHVSLAEVEIHIRIS